MFSEDFSKTQIDRFYPKGVSLDGIGFIFPLMLLVVREALPAERQAPVEVAPVVVLAVGGRLHELKGVQVDGGDVRAHHGRVVLHNPRQ